MLRDMKELLDYDLQATDGTIGDLKDFYFDDEAWVVRYLIVDTGTWLSSRKVLVSPIAIHGSSATGKVLLSSLSREQVQHSPNIDTDKPVSRQHELQHLNYYGHPRYWEAMLPTSDIYPSLLTGFHEPGKALADRWSQLDRTSTTDKADRAQNAHPHLRSYNAVLQYHIRASDGEIGRVEGMLVDEESWAIRYLIVNTRTWWFDHDVLIAPQWIRNVSWPDRTVTVDLCRQAVRLAPPYDPSVPLDPELELRIFEHYGHGGHGGHGPAGAAANT